MDSEQHQPFRLLDLPGEIRNKIYKCMLCPFDPAPPSRQPGRGMVRIHRGEIQEPTGICQATHSIDTTILRTCKQVHREAYDVMVKTNQFINISSVDLPMDRLIVPFQLPIVTMDREHTKQFGQYILKVEMSVLPGGWVDGELDSDHEWEMVDPGPHLQAPPVGFGPRFNFMILGRDWDAFCTLLADADTYIDGFSVCVDLRLTFNPAKIQFLSPGVSALPSYQAPIAQFFTPKYQQTLLKPFRTKLRGFQNVRITGQCLWKLADATVEEVAKSQWTDPVAILRSVTEAKEEGNVFYQANQMTEASEKWTAASSDIRRMRNSSAWPALRAIGGIDFLNRLAEAYFIILLNSAQCSLKIMQGTPQHSITMMTMGDIVSGNLHEAVDVPHEFMHDGASWTPSDEQLAKLYYRQALCWRLMAEVEVIDDALHWIEQALVHAPGDPVIRRERRAILEWVRRTDEQMRTDAVYQEWRNAILNGI